MKGNELLDQIQEQEVACECYP